MAIQTDTGEDVIPAPFVVDDATEFDGGTFAFHENASVGAEVTDTGSAQLEISAQPKKTPEVIAGASSTPKPTLAPSAAKEASTAPLPSLWLSNEKSQREIPKAAKVGGAGMTLLLLLVFVAPKACGADNSVERSSMIAEADVEDADHLKKRRHLTDDDFRSRHSSPALAARPALQATEVDVAERQRLRSENPEDIRAAQTSRRKAGHQTVQKGAKVQPEDEESLFVFFNKPKTTHGEAKSREHVLLPAASMVGITLAADVVIRRGRTTVIAVVRSGQRLPAGTKLIGHASSGFDETLTIRFDSVVLPSGKSIRARAEALDVSSGSSDLVGSMVGGVTPGRNQPGIARSVGTSTAERVAVGALGSGILGGAAQQTLSESSRSRSTSQRSARVVTLSRDTPLQALFLRELLSFDGR